MHRSLTLIDKKRIIYTYFGSLARFDRPVMPILSVAKKLRIAFSTVHYNLKRFIRGGHDFDAMSKQRDLFANMS